MDLIFIRVPENLADNYSWVRRGSSSSSAMQTGSMLDAAEDAKGAQVVLLVPTEKVLITNIEVPTKKDSVRLKAAPHLLSDQIASNIEDLHFCVGPSTDEEATIAVVDKRLIEGWIGLCKAHGLHARAIIPDCLSIPWHAGGWSVLVEQNQALVRTDAGMGYSCHPAMLDTLLQSAIEEQPPEHIQLWLSPGTDVELNIEDKNINLLVEEGTTDALEFLATGWNSKQQIDLQQGEHGLGQNLGLKFKPWRWAAALFGAFLLFQVINMFIEQQQLQKQEQLLSIEIERVFKRSFPNAKTVSGIRKRMSDRLTQLGGSAEGSSDMMPLLAQSSEIVVKKQGSKMESFNFRSGDLELSVSANSLSELEALRSDIAAATGMEIGFRANSSGGKNVGTITIKGGGL